MLRAGHPPSVRRRHRPPAAVSAPQRPSGGVSEAISSPRNGLQASHAGPDAYSLLRFAPSPLAASPHPSGSCAGTRRSRPVLIRVPAAPRTSAGSPCRGWVCGGGHWARAPRRKAAYWMPAWAGLGLRASAAWAAVWRGPVSVVAVCCRAARMMAWWASWGLVTPAASRRRRPQSPAASARTDGSGSRARRSRPVTGSGALVRGDHR
jgi:hypothetical protein